MYEQEHINSSLIYLKTACSLAPDKSENYKYNQFMLNLIRNLDPIFTLARKVNIG